LAPVRRDRTYQLALVSSDGKSRLPLRSRFADDGDVRSQTVFRASPGGKWLAYGDDAGALRLLDGARASFTVASSYTDFRFSPDGRWLAVAARLSVDNHAPRWHPLPDHELVLIDLQGPVPVSRSLAKLYGILRVEWSAAGVLVQLAEGDGPELILVSLSGTQRVVHRGAVQRFASAARGYRVLVFGLVTVVEYDLSQPERFSRDVAFLPSDERMINVEMTADGSATVYVMSKRVELDRDGFKLLDGDQLFLVEGMSEPRRIAANLVTSLWAADDGARFVWQDNAGMHLGDVVFTLARRDPLVSVRFRRDAPGFVAAVGTVVLSLDATGHDPKQLWRDPEPYESVIGADSYAGGLVVWTEREDRTPRLIRRRW
jgi:hypothetical protein